ncbi:S8 family serine peptidase [Microcoleus sp. FACHB-1515]|uniref:S8 family peptidase n=1 Tax=Cyanophyceae TaxID=3028117 RepID=UPI0016860434|nr:S8 family peptidase [Microcoleus sp. FACHB-1515]MBD2091585.1 S8 family serine peptidase [Microcoleus sp. FACHB-1515]
MPLPSRSLAWPSQKIPDPFASSALKLRRSSASIAIGLGESRQGQLTDSDRSNWLRADAYADDYHLRGLKTGETVRIDLQSRAFDPYLQLVNAKTGKLLWHNNDRTANSTTASITFTARSNQFYRLRVTSAEEAGKGRYFLKTIRNPKPQIVFNREYGYGLVNAADAVAGAIAASTGSRWTRFASQPNVNAWNLDLINASEVWAQGYSGQNVTVAVLDTGVDHNHPDLQTNLWQNLNEVPDNGIDDDRNGYIDDVRGWNFADAQDNNDPMDTDQHGTHVAGTIAATHNNFGVTGIAYSAKIMPVRVIGGVDDYRANLFDRNVAAGIRYAVDNGARVLNLSLGNFLGDPTMKQTRSALRYATNRGAIAVMASGNERNEGANRPIEPAAFARFGLGVGVGAIDRTRQLADFSNPAGNRPLTFLAAPGVNVRSTIPNRRYAQNGWSGTSMATAHISATIALMLSANPNLRTAQVLNILTATADSTGIQDYA